MKKLSLAILISAITLTSGCVNAQPVKNNEVAKPEVATPITKTLPTVAYNGNENIRETVGTKVLYPTSYIAASKFVTNPKTKAVLYDTAELPTMEKNGKPVDQLYLNFKDVVVSPVKSTEYLKFGSTTEHQKVDLSKKLNIFFQPNATLTNVAHQLHLHQSLVDDMLRVANHTKDANIKGWGNTEAAKTFFNAYASADTVPVMYLEVKDLHDVPDYISILTRDGDIQTRAMVVYNKGFGSATFTDYYGFRFDPNEYIVKNNNEVLGLTSSSINLTTDGKEQEYSGIEYMKSFTDDNAQTLIFGINLTDTDCDVSGTGYGCNPTSPYIGYLIVHKVK